MTPADWLALLRVPATAVATADTCTARQLAGSLDGFDAAAGHRYTQLVVTNVSAQPCTVQGYPGIGARGEWGSAFPMIVSQTDRSGTAGAEAEQPVITLQPGQSAAAAMEWTGELAGAQSEPIAVLVIQVAQGGDPIRVEPIVHLGDVSTADSADTQVPDIGMLTTVYVGAFLPA